MQLIVIICAVIAPLAAMLSSADVIGKNASSALDNIDSKGVGEALIEESLYKNSSYNVSTIRFESQRNITNAPVSLSVGNGYYSSHPIVYNSAIGSQTDVVSKGSAASLHHEVESAKGVRGTTEFVVADSSYSLDDSEYISTTTTQMNIDETVTEGKIHTGALQGDVSSGLGPAKSGTNPLMNPWKDPALEMEENYIGTYYISKNLTINSDYRRKASSDSWLDCCLPGYYDINIRDPQFGLPIVSADEVFSYNFVGGVAQQG
jgi:hypothetical protein